MSRITSISCLFPGWNLSPALQSGFYFFLFHLWEKRRKVFKLERFFNFKSLRPLAMDLAIRRWTWLVAKEAWEWYYEEWGGVPAGAQIRHLNHRRAKLQIARPSKMKMGSSRWNERRRREALSRNEGESTRCGKNIAFAFLLATGWIKKASHVHITPYLREVANSRLIMRLYQRKYSCAPSF